MFAYCRETGAPAYLVTAGDQLELLRAAGVLDGVRTHHLLRIGGLEVQEIDAVGLCEEVP